MNTSIWSTIAYTPWWVFAIFMYLVYMGYLASKPRIVSVGGLFVLPIFFIPLSIFSLYVISALTLRNTAIWTSTLVLGSLLGWLHFRVMKIKAIKGEWKLYLPGTWLVMIFVLSLFAVKYHFGFSYGMNPELLLQPKFIAFIVALYGFFAGLFIGRLISTLYCLKKGPFHDTIAST